MLGALSLLPQQPALVWNLSASVPVGLYRLEQTPPTPGDILALRPQGAVAEALATFGVMDEGRLLLKPVAAREGDTVCRQHERVLVNGAIAAHARSHTRRGEELPQWEGCRQLETGDLFLLSPHPASFDSRYFGPVAASDVVGVAHAVATFPPRAARQRDVS